MYTMNFSMLVNGTSFDFFSGLREWDSFLFIHVDDGGTWLSFGDD